MKVAILSCALLVLCLASSGESNVRRKRIVGGQPAPVPPEDDPVVYVYRENEDAKVIGIREKKTGFYTYQGIRYALPPVGLYRFQRPKPIKMQGLINATLPPPPCPQPDPDQPSKVIGSEDCLFLNIYSAELPDGSGAGLPVLVWIHGGGYRRGSANLYGPGPLISKKVVLVTINYRLGSLGFLSAGAPQLSGNAAMFDMAAAVKWVQKYISFFGGDPKNVKTIGQGSGASSAVALGMNPSSSEKLSGVVAMSGSPTAPNAVDKKPKEASTELSDLLGCPASPPLQTLRCLQQVKVEDLIMADSKLQAFRLAEQGPLGAMGGVTSPSPVVDGRSLDADGEPDGDDDRFLPAFYPQAPIRTLNESDFPAIPLLTGVCKHETGRAVQGEVKAKLDLFKGKISGITKYVNNIIGNQLTGFASSAVPLAGALGLDQIAKNPLFERAASSALSAADAVNAATQQIASATTDVFFNLPAALTSSFWSAKAPAFLYSLEHPSKQAAALGQMFLSGLPVIESARGATPEGNQSFVSHGDDLAFLFNARSLEGKNNDNELSLSDPADLKMRDHFTTLVAEFAKSGAATVPGAKDKGKEKDKSILPSFSGGGKDSKYLVLDSAPHVGSDFHTNVLGAFGKALGGVGGLIGGVPGVGNVLSGKGGPLGLLGGGGGSGSPKPAGAAPPAGGAKPAGSKPKRRKIQREKPKAKEN